MGFSFKIKKPVKAKKRIVDAPQDDKKMIESFSGVEEEKKPLVIAPDSLRTTISRTATSEEGEDGTTTAGGIQNEPEKLHEKVAEKETEKGHENNTDIETEKSVKRQGQSVIGARKIDSEDPETQSYEEVPVEQFGAALLRGMGWKEQKTKKSVPQKNQRLVLGIGAKAIEDSDISQQLLSTKAKFSVPMVRKKKE